MARADAVDLVGLTLLREGPASRAQLARATGLADSTVSAVVADLCARGVAEEEVATGAVAGRRGRPPVLVRLHRRTGAVVGLDLGRTHVRAAVVDLGHRVLAEDVAPVDGDASATAQLDVVDALAGRLLEEAGVPRAAVRSAVLGLPGPVHRRTGRIGDGAILPGWVGLVAGTIAAERLGFAVRVENDANLGAFGEWVDGAARGVATAAYVKLSTGIGAGLVLQGRPFAGTGGTAGELGHLVLDPAGAPCRCGHRGCLETIAGGRALLAGGGWTSTGALVAAARAGDTAAVAALARAGAAVGSGVAMLCNLLNPERVVLGGPLAEAGALLLDPLRAALADGAVASAHDDVDVVAAHLGEHAEVRGAVALALRSVTSPLVPAP